MTDPAHRPADVIRVTRGAPAALIDTLAVEEPLEIRLATAGEAGRPISITMRTPGHDAELAAGFLMGEGLVRSASDIAGIVEDDATGCGRSAGNTLTVVVRPGLAIDPARLERHFYTTSSCGVCGKASLDALEALNPPAIRPRLPEIGPDVVHRLPGLLRECQPVFSRTGGLHGAGLVTPEGVMMHCREDVGRHNAVDKTLGRALLDGSCPLSDCILLLSGRASFELIQKGAMAGIPIVAAVGAPSTLAVDYASRRGMTLLGFVRDTHFNVYTGAERIASLEPVLPILTP
ncbi:MAG: formate dehydrogenase accessory sulfurtransferase FdhD [Rhodothermales bacterium]